MHLPVDVQIVHTELLLLLATPVLVLWHTALVHLRVISAHGILASPTQQ